MGEKGPNLLRHRISARVAAGLAVIGLAACGTPDFDVEVNANDYLQQSEVAKPIETDLGVDAQIGDLALDTALELEEFVDNNGIELRDSNSDFAFTVGEVPGEHINASVNYLGDPADKSVDNLDGVRIHTFHDKEDGGGVNTLEIARQINSPEWSFSIDSSPNISGDNPEVDGYGLTQAQADADELFAQMEQLAGADAQG